MCVLLGLFPAEIVGSKLLIGLFWNVHKLSALSIKRFQQGKKGWKREKGKREREKGKKEEKKGINFL